MLKIWIRKKQYFNVYGQPIYWVGNNPNSLTAQQGYLPNNNWVDYTEDVGNLDDLSLTFTEWRNRDGDEVRGVSFVRRTASGTLLIEGAAYQFLKSWLIEDVAAPLNSIEVRIIDTLCEEKYDNWVITRGQVGWCESDDICQFEVSLQQADETYHCIQKTLINDNWKGWFTGAQANTKKHPRFSYCNEIRPNGPLVIQFYVALSTLTTSSIFIFPMILLLNSIFFAINGVIALINGISSLLGGSATAVNYISFLDPNDIFSGMAQMFLETAGCGREHPAPLIRDYIWNVCEKCGVAVDAVSVPIFFSPTISLEASSGPKTNVLNPHYNACYFYAPIKRGIRRFRNLNLLNGYQDFNYDDYYIPENAPDIALSDFLDMLKKVYNAEWRVKRVNGVPTLYFWRKDWFIDTAPLYDFTQGSADRLKILEGVCFEARDIKFPATVDGMYSEDSIDSCGNEARKAMNGYAYAFDNTDNNPNYEGVIDSKTLDFGATKFRLDGHSKDYIFDAAQIVLNGSAVIFLSTSFINPFAGLVMGLIFKGLMRFCDEFADYALLLKDETASMGKILLWDGAGFENAKCIKTHKPYPTTNSSLPMPSPNPDFNTKQWHELFSVESFVRGQNLSFANTPAGVYQVKDYFGVQYASKAAEMPNFPMYFNPAFQDTIWDWFWWTEDPKKNPKLGLDWYVRLELCCDELTATGVTDDASDLAIGRIVRLPTAFYQNGKVTEITVSYKSDNEIGKYLELKGEV